MLHKLLQNSWHMPNEMVCKPLLFLTCGNLIMQMIFQKFVQILNQKT